MVAERVEVAAVQRVHAEQVAGGQDLADRAAVRWTGAGWYRTSSPWRTWWFSQPPLSVQ